MTESFSPCRLFVYLALGAPIGVVLRRGPSRWVQLSVWHTETDTFDHGQWIRGRVYERRSDVSPDGSLFVYFVRKDGVRSADIEQVDSWIAISRPPWFTALALWVAGGTYFLGGYFPDTRRVYAGGWTDGPDKGTLPPWLTLTSSLPYVDRSSDWTERTVYFSRLLRDGWSPIDAGTWERRAPEGNQILAMTHESDSDFRAFGGPHIVSYTVRTVQTPEPIPLGRVTWADWDQQGRLVLARRGKLVHWLSEGVEEEILDFNQFAPAPAPSPPWAETWAPPGTH